MALHPQLQADAERILTDASMPWARVIAVDGDSILYENKQQRARTCWLHRTQSGYLKVRMVEGFQSEPPDGWHQDGTELRGA